MLCALLHWNDTSTIEAKHASIRRLLFASSVQTHKQSFDELSSNWLFMQARNRTTDFAPWETAALKKKAYRMAAKTKRVAKQEQAAACVCSHSCRLQNPGSGLNTKQSHAVAAMRAA